MYLSSANYGMHFTMVAFVRNVAGLGGARGRGRGGAVVVAANNGKGKLASVDAIQFINSLFIANEGVEGGAIFAFMENR